ncbi:hypothetical protein D3C86_2040920 [compost metagenome]
MSPSERPTRARKTLPSRGLTSSWASPSTLKTAAFPEPEGLFAGMGATAAQPTTLVATATSAAVVRVGRGLAMRSSSDRTASLTVDKGLIIRI